MYWTTKAGEKILITDLETSHLENIIKLMLMVCAKESSSILTSKDRAYFEATRYLNGEHAIYCIDEEWARDDWERENEVLDFNEWLNSFKEWVYLREELAKRMGSDDLFIIRCNKYLVSLGYDYEVDGAQQ